jgi:hypothetical protein
MASLLGGENTSLGLSPLEISRTLALPGVSARSQQPRDVSHFEGLSASRFLAGLRAGGCRTYSRQWTRVR